MQRRLPEEGGRGTSAPSLAQASSFLESAGISSKLRIYLKLRKPMILLRLYVAVLTLGLLCVFCFTRGIGLLEGTVIVCPLLFLIFDMHNELREFRQLERRVNEFLASL